MKWVELDDAIRSELLERELKNPRIRLGALENLARLLKNVYPEISGRAELLLDVGKQALSSRLAQLKETGTLNGAEKSVINQIFDLLENRAINPPSAFPDKHEPRRVKIRSIPENPKVAKAGLRPLILEDSTILVLGTLPGDESIRLQQYYAKPSNEFWKILSAVYGQAIDLCYTNRVAFLRSKGLALWDVLKSAERIGSSDAAIKDAVPNDFSE